MPDGADAAPAAPALPGEMLREQIVSQLAVLSILADLASGHAFVGDDLATGYCLLSNHGAVAVHHRGRWRSRRAISAAAQGPKTRGSGRSRRARYE